MVHNGDALDMAPIRTHKAETFYFSCFFFLLHMEVENANFFLGFGVEPPAALKQWRIFCVNESNRQHHQQCSRIVKCKMACVLCNPNLLSPLIWIRSQATRKREHLKHCCCRLAVGNESPTRDFFPFSPRSFHCVSVVSRTSSSNEYVKATEICGVLNVDGGGVGK